ncbi:hypothetical protein [Comamonas testosteroni]|uniref:Uncharacterized protein n=1 Tax=Comamonas testosteroni TaxID=285 RepID=A0A096FKA1_COMTE|nr:hypothetical protein [Comamonas testosteroni]KGH30791.1 hypothetical protein P353_07995 [Comamonas testosteroni]WKL18892.1 hypothetical protein QYQ99_28240 [Comamonas testosteroni]
MMDSIEVITSEQIPELFRNPLGIGDFGKLVRDPEIDVKLDKLLGSNPSAGLARSIRGVVMCLEDADPKAISEKPSKWSRFTGLAQTKRVRFEVAKINMDQLLNAATKEAALVRDVIDVIESLCSTYGAEAQIISNHIEAGQKYLAQTPDSQGGALAFDLETSRERFSRRLINLQAMQVSHAQTGQQLQLLKYQLIDVLDRFDETAQVLVPLWRQNMLGLGVQNHVTGEQLAMAIQAHENLRKSFADNLKSISVTQ